MNDEKARPRTIKTTLESRRFSEWTGVRSLSVRSRGSCRSVPRTVQWYTRCSIWWDADDVMLDGAYERHHFQELFKQMRFEEILEHEWWKKIVGF